MCLHIRNTTTKVKSIETKAVTNKKISSFWLSRETILSLFCVPIYMLLVQLTISFLYLIWCPLFKKVFGNFNKSGFKEMGKICSYTV